MIPKASQRAHGQDLATHLLNAQDNEYLDVAEVRGAVARDLHGAFAEWEVQAHALTKCRNYLYSLSVNPDPAQGRLTRDQYLEFVDRTEKKLGLEGQPRAIVFHIKDGREHCHVVWSRIDIEKGKAIHQAFDHEKLMMVTRQFARDHGLALPDGMKKDAARDPAGKRPLTLYDRHQELTTGLSKEERVQAITDAWRRCDIPKAFVRALEEQGYILATGDRPYLVVDRYGHVSALPRLIEDRTVRLKDVRAFLEKDYPPDSLPTVEEARALAAVHRKGIEAFGKAEAKHDQRDALKAVQAARRKPLLAEKEAMAERHRQERHALDQSQATTRRAQRQAYRTEAIRVRADRAKRAPQGLAAFLGRVSGVALVMRKIHRWQDARRLDAFLDRKQALEHLQRAERQVHQRRHELQALDLNRRLRALDKVDARELKSLETAQLRRRRTEGRARSDHMPALRLELKPPGRAAAPHKAKNRFISPLAQELAERAKAHEAKNRRTPVDDVSRVFNAAAAPEQRRGHGDDTSRGPRPPERPRPPMGPEGGRGRDR